MTRQTRKIVRIDPDKCNGCGLCVPKCAEGAIRIIDGKARLVAENLCDGLGNCLGTCPRGAITIEERPAEAFDDTAVEASRSHARAPEAAPGAASACAGGTGPLASRGCPGAMLRKLKQMADRGAPAAGPAAAPAGSRLGQWPVQLALLPPAGDIWQDADVLIAADCVAYAMGDFHDRLLAGRTLAVACPKLDDVQPYVEKLAAVFAAGGVRSVTVARMEVPCCGGLERLVREALAKADSAIPLDVIVVGIDGRIQNVNGVKVA